MAYNDLSECILSDRERAAEKDCIVPRLMRIVDRMKPHEQHFVRKMMNGGNFITVKQWYWLHDLNRKYK